MKRTHCGNKLEYLAADWLKSSSEPFMQELIAHAAVEQSDNLDSAALKWTRGSLDFSPVASDTEVEASQPVTAQRVCSALEGTDGPGYRLDHPTFILKIFGTTVSSTEEFKRQILCSHFLFSFKYRRHWKKNNNFALTCRTMQVGW